MFRTYAVIALLFGYPMLVLSPLLQFVTRHQKPMKSSEFSMMDLLALMFLFQTPLVLLQVRDVRRWDSSEVIFSAFTLIIPLLLWFPGLRAANHLGVKSQWKRAVLIGFTFPVAILGAFFLPTLVFVPEFVTPNLNAPAMIFCAFSLTAYASVVWVIHDCEPNAEANTLNEKSKANLSFGDRPCWNSLFASLPSLLPT